MIIARRIISQSTDQHASLKTDTATPLVQKEWNAEKLRHGNGGTQTSHISNMLQVFSHHHIEDKLTKVMLNKRQYGLTQVLLPKV
jgi:hypothetical protein